MSVAAAIRSGDLAELPSRRDEDWRWTDIRALVRSLPPASDAGVPAHAAGPFSVLADREVVLLNGRGGADIRTPAGGRETVALRVLSSGVGAHAGRISVEVERDGVLTLLESYEGEGAESLSQIDIEIELEPGATLDRIVLVDEGPKSITVSIANVTLGANANLRQTVLTCGGRRQRIETRVRHPGAGACVQMDGLYILDGKRHADITTVVSHEGVEGATDQLVKGVVGDQARGVFQGRILVKAGADRTDARMGHHALILSDQAEVDAKPELEIFADDVLCAHGATVGALDEDALFYARQRGLAEGAARNLLIQAFLNAVVDRVAAAGPRSVAERWMLQRLEAVS